MPQSWNNILLKQVTVPAHKHGTTVARSGVKRMGVAHSWSKHIKEAYDQAVKAAEHSETLVHTKFVYDM
jgi:hypothetical protein